MKIIESFIKAKKEQTQCEDMLFTSQNHIAVIDGVTSKSEFLYEGKTSGQIAAELVYNQLEQVNSSATLSDIIKSINQNINSFYKRVSFPYDIVEKGLQASCVIYSEYYNEVWLIGDCQAMIDGKTYFNCKKSDLILSEMRSLILNIMDINHENIYYNQDTARERILPWIIKSTVFANRADNEYGYSIVNGLPIPQNLICQIPLDNKESHEIVFTSDGYPKVKDSLAASEEYLAKILKMDPECYKIYKSTKGVCLGQNSYDDRTYIRFQTECRL